MKKSFFLITLQTVVATRDSHGFPHLIVPAGGGTRSYNPTSTFQQLLERIVRTGCKSGCDRCPPCPTPTTPTPTTITLTSNGSETTISLGAGLTGYVATGVLLASWLGLWLATKAGWVEVRVTNPPTWCPFPSGGESRHPDSSPASDAAAAAVKTAPTVASTRPPPSTVSSARTWLPATAPPASLPSGPPSYSFYSAASEGEEAIYDEPSMSTAASWV